MAIIGKFTRQNDGTLLGGIKTLTTDILATFEPASKRSGKAPDYRLIADGFEIGAAWTRSGEDGEAHLSVSLDELLGLKGEVRQKDFFALCDNQHPEAGDNLTRNTQANRRVLYDFTFDAPKSVSLAYELGGDTRILESFQSAVSETMSEMEGGMMARVRAKGADEDRVGTRSNARYPSSPLKPPSLRIGADLCRDGPSGLGGPGAALV